MKYGTRAVPRIAVPGGAGGPARVPTGAARVKYGFTGSAANKQKTRSRVLYNVPESTLTDYAAETSFPTESRMYAMPPHSMAAISTRPKVR